MTARRRHRRFTVPQLEGLPTVETLTPAVGRGAIVQEVKLVEPPFRYSLIGSPTLAVRTRVFYEEMVNGGWSPIAIASLGFLFMPMERAAMEANGRGDRVVALLLIHASIEALMRSDPQSGFVTEDRFVDVAASFRRRLIERDLHNVDPEAINRGILEVNRRRNEVIHELLVRDGLDETNARLTAAEFEAWKRTYDATLGAVMEFVTL